MNKKFFITAMGIIMIIMMLVAPNANAVKKDTVTVVEKSDYATLDPSAATDRRDVFNQIYDTLVKVDENNAGAVVPALAKSWEISKDGKEVTFSIRENVKFHNGDTLTAEDVAFSINNSIKSSFTQQITSSMSSAEVVDNNTVKVKLKYAYGPILGCFTCPEMSILNKKAYEADPKGFGRKPIGAGAYRFKEWVPGDKVVLEAFPDYYRGQAPIKNLIFDVVLDRSAALIALETGEVDMIINPAQADRKNLMGNKNLAFYECDSNAIYVIFFNNSKGIFSNKKLREAVSYAVDRDAIILGATEGVSTRVETVIMPGYAGYPENFKGNPYDPEKAKQLLAEAGYPNGFKVKMKTIDSDIYTLPTQIIQEQLRKIGIDVEIEIEERGKWMADIATNSNYEITLYAIVAIIYDADFCVYSQFHSSTIGGSGNWSECKIPELDVLLEQGRASQNAAERKQIYREVSNIIKNESIMIPLMQGKRQYATNKDLKGVKINPAMQFYSYDWSW